MARQLAPEAPSVFLRRCRVSRAGRKRSFSRDGLLLSEDDQGRCVDPTRLTAAVVATGTLPS